MAGSKELLVIQSAKVTNFGCFFDSGEVPIDEITALVAENEYGKTTFLRALAWWSDGSLEFDEEDLREGTRTDILVDIVSITFKVPKGISTRIIREGYTVPDEIRIVRDSAGGYRIENAKTDEILSPIETKARTQLVQQLKLYEHLSDIDPIIDMVLNGNEESAVEGKFYDYVQTQFSPLLTSAQLSTILSLVKNLEMAIEEEGPSAATLMDAVDPFIPKLIYFDDTIEFIDDSISYAAAEADPKKYRTMINVAKLAGFDLIQLGKSPGHRRQTAGHEGQASLSTEISKYWFGSPILFLIQADLNEMLLMIEHRGRKQRPSRRSSGLKWFIGFFVNFVANSDAELNGAILLLDEPGLRLHMAQQPKLLDLFKRLASDGNRIIYSTHLSQMLMADRPKSYRLFVKDPEHPDAAIVLPDVTKLPTKSDVLQPIRQALGMSVANAIGLGGDNLIVEGWIDRMVLLTISSFCRLKDMATLTSHSVSVIPAGGSGTKMLPLASMAVGETTNVVVLVDNDKAGRATEKTLRDNFNNLVPVVRTHYREEHLDFELEDLFDRSYYVGLVNDSHKGIEGFVPIYLSDLDETLSICDALKKHFKKVKLGDFQKMLPAVELQGRLERLQIPEISEIEQFRDLFARIDAAFQA